MRFVRALARGQDEATPLRALVSVSLAVGAVAAVVIAVALLLYGLA